MITTFLERDDATEFNRIKRAARGTLRMERGDDYVIIAHCHTVEYVEVTLLSFTTWYVSVNYKGAFFQRREFDSNLTYDALNAYVTGVIVQHMKGISNETTTSAS